MTEVSDILTGAFYTESDPEEHSHRDPELIYILEGTGCLIEEGEEHYLLQDAMILVNSGRRHRLMLSKEAFAAGLKLDSANVSALLKKKELTFEREIDSDEQIRRILNQLLRTLMEETDGARLLRFGLSCQLVHRLSTHLVKPDHASGEMTEREKRRERMETYLEEHFREPIGLNDLASAIHVTPGYLSKAFKREFGMGFWEYLTEIRLAHCEEELMTSGKTMLENALSNGFQSLSSFNKAFRQRYGVSPTEYRREHKPAVSEKEAEIPAADPGKVKEYFDTASALSMKTSADLVRVTADVEVRRDFKKNWNRLINVGPIEILLRSEMQNQLLAMKEQLGFHYVRVWNVYEAAVQGASDDSAELNYSSIDRALDFVLRNGMKPYLDLEFKPFRVHISKENTFSKSDSEEGGAAYRASALRIRKLLNHLANRYGAKELENWFFEFGKSESLIEELSFEVYLKLYCEFYETCYKTLKEMSEHIRIGGWGFFGSINAEREKIILRFWQRNRCCPDVMTVLLFPYDISPENGVSQLSFSTDRNYMQSSLMKIRKILEDEGYGGVPIHVTEWSNTISQRSILNDSCFKGAYIVQNHIECFDSVELTAYWSLSDLYGESYDTRGILYGGSGLLTVDGIYKPSYYGMEFLNRLQNQVIHKGDAGIVTTNGKGHYTILCHNLKNYSYRFYHCPEDRQNDETVLFENDDPRKIELTLFHVERGKYRIKRRILNQQNGSVLDEWIRLGRGTITANESDYLKAVCRPKMQIRIQEVTDGELRLEAQLEPNEIQLIDVSYLYEE